VLSPERLRRRSLIRNRSRLVRGELLLALVLVAGIIGYFILGLSPLDAVYQTVITVSTVGYREVGVEEPGTAYRIFTMCLVLVGVATALYVFSLAVEGLLAGYIQETLGRRRMTRDIARMSGHVIVCGGGRVGRELATEVLAAGRDVVVIDLAGTDIDLTEDIPVISGDATADHVLESAGLARASVLVAALSDDAQNVYVVLSGRSVSSELLIVARAHSIDAEPKLLRAGANRVVNPQFIGGRRMATYALQPNVAEFLDVVVHSGGLEWRLEEVVVGAGSALDSRSVAEADLRNRVGALVLALRDGTGTFRTNPGRETVLRAGDVLIAMGTDPQLKALEEEAAPG